MLTAVQFPRNRMCNFCLGLEMPNFQGKSQFGEETRIHHATCTGSASLESIRELFQLSGAVVSPSCKRNKFKSRGGSRIEEKRPHFFCRKTGRKRTTWTEERRREGYIAAAVAYNHEDVYS
jgi:hypothetical protein